MKTKSSVNKVNQSRQISVAWPPFQEKLGAVLNKLDEDQYLIVSVKGSNRYIQFAAQGSFGMRVETVSNSYLDKSEQLDDLQITALIDAGWQAPTRAPADSTPEADPDGSPNYFLEFPAPITAEAIASLTVRTFTEILRVPHPGFLQYEAFEMDGGAIAVPELGLKRAQRRPRAKEPEDLSQLLLATLKKTTGIGDLDFDDDGEVGIRYGSALTFVGLKNDPPQVRICSPILRDVEKSKGVLARLNEINASETVARLIFRKGTIYSDAHISAAPFVSAHVAKAFVHCCALADGIDEVLQAEFGGRTVYGEPMSSVMKH